MIYLPWIAFALAMFWTIREVLQAIEEDVVRRKSELLFKKLQPIGKSAASSPVDSPL
ncbi:MAG TPA: hypothetical protein VII25_06450 [Candidatus Acidoferrum sp.]